MKAKVEDGCVACGLCEETCPAVFLMFDDVVDVIVDEVPRELEDDVMQAVDDCPVGVIIIEYE